MSINVSDAEMMLRCEDRGHNKNGIYSSLAGLLFPYLGTSGLESWMLTRSVGQAFQEGSKWREKIIHWCSSR